MTTIDATLSQSAAPDNTATKFILTMPTDAKFIPIIPELVEQIGLWESILLLQIAIWIKGSHNIREGKYWAYKSLRDIHDDDIPYLSIEMIRRVIQNLKTQGYILIGDFNEKGYDRTQWFALEPDKCSSLLGVFVNILPDKKPDLSTMLTPPISPSRIEGESTQLTTIPENLKYKEMSTSLSTGVAVERVLEQESVAKENEPTVQESLTVAEQPALFTPATESTLPTPTRRKIIVISEPECEEVVVDDDKPANRTKGGRKRKEGTIPAECINPMKAAIMKAFGWSWDTASDAETGQVYKAAKQLCKTKFPVEQVPDLYALCKKKFTQFGPVALTTNQSEFRKLHPPAPAQNDSMRYNAFAFREGFDD